jgi:hypothetical protein
MHWITTIFIVFLLSNYLIIFCFPTKTHSAAPCKFRHQILNYNASVNNVRCTTTRTTNTGVSTSQQKHTDPHAHEFTQCRDLSNRPRLASVTGAWYLRASGIKPDISILSLWIFSRKSFGEFWINIWWRQN